MRSLSILSSIVLASLAIPGRADTFTFNFNSLASGASASQIAAYMNSYFIAHGCSTCSVTVTGAVADKTYDGDGNVVGPNGQPLTLGTSDGATSNSSTTPTGSLGKTNNLLSGSVDTFIANTNDSAHQVSNEFYLAFSGLKIDSVSFDYEIFPDGSPEQPPDFEFEAGTNKNGTDPLVSGFGTGGIRYGVVPSSSGSDGSSVKSPDSTHEASAQYIGTWSGSLNDATELDFVDWPATIAIDNLTITTNPEPGSVILMLTVAAGAWLGRKKFQRS